MPKKRLLVVGNSYMNFVSTVRRAPERAETVVSNFEFDICPGGFGYISALTAATLGIDTVLCTRIGEDENGEKLKKILLDRDVDTRFAVTDKRRSTGVKSLTVEENHKTRTIVYPGANLALTFDDIETAFTSYPDLLLINFDLRDELVFDAVKFANLSSVPIVLSCSRNAKEFDFGALDSIEVFSCDREVAYYLTGIDPIDASTALHACVKLVNQLKCKYIVIKLEQRGTFVYDGTYSQIMPLYNSNYIDDTGATAVFDAALACSYLEFNDINKATAIANAAISFSFFNGGGYRAIPKKDDIISFLDR